MRKDAGTDGMDVMLEIMSLSLAYNVDTELRTSKATRIGAR